MEAFSYIPGVVWGSFTGLLGICLGAYLTNWFSRKQLIDDQKRDSLIQVARCVNPYYANETDSLTKLCHLMNEAMVRFSSEKLREAIYGFLSSDGYTVNTGSINRSLFQNSLFSPVVPAELRLKLVQSGRTTRIIGGGSVFCGFNQCFACTEVSVW